AASDVYKRQQCGYTANVEVAQSISEDASYELSDLEEIHTPNLKTVKEVSDFLKLSPKHFIKSLLYICGDKPILALVRGDQELHEKKLSKILKSTIRPAHKEEVLEILGVEAGFIGPIGHNVLIIADNTLSSGCYISGANKSNYHIRGIVPDKHFKAQWHDIHIAKEGDKCINCKSILYLEKVIEIGNIFKLGTKYSVPLKAFYLNQEGKELPIVMGSYGIGPARIAAAAIEQNHDKDGIIWHKNIAPFDLHIIPLNLKDTQTNEITHKIFNEMTSQGYEILIDNRDERPGVKFKDADLIGIPYQLIIGEKAIKQGFIELKSRKTREITKIELQNPVSQIVNVLNS
ncbi:MAG: His/Gly/Thr/Pro-type tRNA ligase C-terminal domain-containing protein, partial [Thermodesulfovibrionales bacterium]|nr:His/Gly/Thr/Pro-type tRNA ligase C-terminal domain-containing protein [Thermodesulfovibrionales bacterium]